jgi:hypothetical protein
MKKIIYVSALAIFLFLIGNSAIAQLRKIPAEVTTAFTEKYPNATAVEWRDKLTGFTASFTQDSITYIASFGSKGDWESTEHYIDQEALPDSVKEGFSKSKYTDWNISQVTLIELPNDEIQYRIEVGKGDIKKRNLYYNTEGRMLKDKLTL